METTCERGLKECEVLISIPIKNKEQLEHIFKAGEELSKAGVVFDTGAGCGMRDWEFDWSLKGAKVYFKRFKEELNGTSN